MLNIYLLVAGLALLGTVQGVKATSLIAKYKGRFSTETTTTTKIPDNDEVRLNWPTKLRPIITRIK